MYLNKISEFPRLVSVHWSGSLRKCHESNGRAVHAVFVNSTRLALTDSRKGEQPGDWHLAQRREASFCRKASCSSFTGSKTTLSKQQKQGIYQSDWFFWKSFHSGIIFLNTFLWDHLQRCHGGGRNIFSRAQAQLPVAAPWEGPRPPGAALNTRGSNTPGPSAGLHKHLQAPATEDSLDDRPVRNTLKIF